MPVVARGSASTVDWVWLIAPFCLAALAVWAPAALGRSGQNRFARLSEWALLMLAPATYIALLVLAASIGGE